MPLPEGSNTMAIITTQLGPVTDVEFDIHDRGGYDDMTIDTACVLCGAICAGPSAPSHPTALAVVAQLLDDSNPCGHRHDDGLRDGCAMVCQACAPVDLWQIATAVSDLDDALMTVESRSRIKYLLDVTERLMAEATEGYRSHSDDVLWHPQP